MNIPEEYWLKDNENISPISTINKLKTLNKVEISELQRPKLQNVKEVKTKILNANDSTFKTKIFKWVTNVLIINAFIFAIFFGKTNSMDAKYEGNLKGTHR